jgi:RNA polymerase sigma-70 factor (ECF subfamily)
MPLSPQHIAALVERHAVPLQVWIGRRCDIAEDVVQEAFCRLAVLDPPPDQPAAWLYRVVRNLAETDRLSGRRRRHREKRVAAPESFNDDLSVRLDVNVAIKAVWQLDDALREVVTARIWGQLTFEEIGEMCSISTATASRRYRSALEQLRKQLRISCPT